MIQHTTTRRRFLAGVGGAVTVAVAGCVGGGTESESSPTDSPADEPVEVAMITDNNGPHFDPKGLHIEGGTAVRFVPVSGSHSATAYHPDNDRSLRIPDPADPWDTGLLAESDSAISVTFDESGVYDYFCKPHESMGQVGRIVVDEPSGGPGTQPPENLPPAARENLPAVEQILDEGSVPGP